MQASVAVVHDYLTQRGGAERVVLSLLRAFPQATLHTALYEPESTFPAFVGHSIQTLPLNRVGAFRRDHRLALPLLATSYSRLQVEADVVVCSSSGWAHGVRTSGRKVAYCYAPARWLYQRERYLREAPPWSKLVLGTTESLLRRWDQRAATSCDRYVTSSRSVRDAIMAAYGIAADVVPPPYGIDPHGEMTNVPGITEGFILCVARLQPYKNVDAIIRAVATMDDQRLVVVGRGPDRARLEALGNARIRFIDTVSDGQLRWLYAHCRGLVAASYEDYGLTPLEAAAFAKPSAVLRWGGFLDTVVEGTTGVFFDEPEPGAVARGIWELVEGSWDEAAIVAHAERFAEPRFITRMQAIVAEELDST